MISNKDFQEQIKPGDIIINDDTGKLYTFKNFFLCRTTFLKGCQSCKGKLVLSGHDTQCFRDGSDISMFRLRFTIIKKINFGIDDEDFLI